MRYIDINNFLVDLPEPVRLRLANRHQELVDGNDQQKQTIIGNGNTTWRDTKPFLEAVSNRKCWYTESRNPGFPNEVEHFRPKGKILDDKGGTLHWYWFLAFDPLNYRLSCNFPNRLNINPETALTGGKGDKFPLLKGKSHAKTIKGITKEKPLLLDPCNANDCALLDFLPDGRPVISALHRKDKNNVLRVEQSNLLLNLDFPTFNEDREALYNNVKEKVDRGDRYGPDNPAFEDVKLDLKRLMHKDSPYSKAAECYIRCFRDREWVDELFIVDD